MPTKTKKRPKPFFYRVTDDAGVEGFKVGMILVERKGYGPILSRMYTSTTANGHPDKVRVMRAVKVPHSELPAEAVENAIKYLEANP